MYIDYNKSWDILTSELMQHFNIDKNQEEFIKLMQVLHSSFIEQYKGDVEQGYKDIEEATGFQFARYSGGPAPDSEDEYEWSRPEK